MWRKVSRYIENNIKLLGGILVIIVISIWLLSQFSPALHSWMLNQGLLNVITVVLLVDVLTRLAEMKSLSRKSIRIHTDQYELLHADTINFIRRNKIRRVDLIEYSTASLDQLFIALSNSNCQIRILLQYPKNAISQYQKDRIKYRIADIFERFFKGYDLNRVEIRGYCTPASIRGRNFDDKLVTIGWYTYSANSTGDEIIICGDTNPMVMAHVNDPEGEILHQLFNKTFNELWEHPDTKLIMSGPSIR